MASRVTAGGWRGWSRAALTAGLLLALPWAAGCGTLFGTFAHQPEELDRGLSPAAKALVQAAFADLGAAPLEDYHAHVFGRGTGGTGATLSSGSDSWLHLSEHLRARVLATGGGVTDWDRFDQQYVERLVRLARAFGRPLRIHLLALDRCYRPDGTVDAAHTALYVPNDYVLRLAQEYPDVFVPVVSVHPYRADALAELERCAAAGARTVKWLPNAQGMDPADPRLDEFYRVLRERHLVLLTHAGREDGVLGAERQDLGNPLRFRRALDHGVTVIMAHAGGLGTSADLDQPGRTAENLELVLRLLGEARYAGRLFLDISALTAHNRLGPPLFELLRRPELHPWLVNGSDYPTPAVDFAIWTRQAVDLELITPAERTAVNEIYDYNPLLFDFVLKRLLRDPQSGRRFPPSVFLANPRLARALSGAAEPPRAAAAPPPADPRAASR